MPTCERFVGSRGRAMTGGEGGGGRETGGMLGLLHPSDGLEE